MRGLATGAMLALLAACQSGAPAPGDSRNSVQPPANVAAPQANEAAAIPPDPPADLAGMSPRQRRAYAAGLADCQAGRYDPDPWPEAYRIGCAAANDR